MLDAGGKANKPGYAVGRPSPRRQALDTLQSTMPMVQPQPQFNNLGEGVAQLNVPLSPKPGLGPIIGRRMLLQQGAAGFAPGASMSGVPQIGQ